jgi:F-type H+-transporting ATPase subunit alpha
MKQIAGRLRLDLAQYRELAAFAQFGSDLDKATQRQLERGARMVEILKQDQYEPLSVELQVLIIFAGTQGYTDKLPVESLKSYEKDLFAFVKDEHADLLETIREKKTLDEELKKKLDKVITEFNESFEA